MGLVGRGDEGAAVGELLGAEEVIDEVADEGKVVGVDLVVFGVLVERFLHEEVD